MIVQMGGLPDAVPWGVSLIPEVCNQIVGIGTTPSTSFHGEAFLILLKITDIAKSVLRGE